MISRSLMVVSLILVAVFRAPTRHTLEQAAWRIDPKPTLDVGGGEQDTLDEWKAVAGVARLPNGDVVVAEQQGHTLRYFAASGKFRRSAVRQGDGPGEIPGAGTLWMLHCGDSLFMMDWNHRMHVFSEAAGFTRTVVATPTVTGDSPYEIRCNAARNFISYGWDRKPNDKAGTFRPIVPYWISNPDGSIRARLGEHGGSERFADMMSDGRIGGSGPLPLGKQPAVAIGRTRAYIGLADSFAIDVYSLDGKQLSSIIKPRVDLTTTPADIARSLMLDTAGKTDARKASRMKQIALSVKYPRTIPAYSDLVVDSDDNLWVQRYPRAGDAASHWVVFSPTGVEVAGIDLPLNLKVSEIGRDYVLGWSPELPDGVVHVKVFHLIRGSGR